MLDGRGGLRQRVARQLRKQQQLSGLAHGQPSGLGPLIRRKYAAGRLSAPEANEYASHYPRCDDAVINAFASTSSAKNISRDLHRKASRMSSMPEIYEAKIPLCYHDTGSQKFEVCSFLLVHEILENNVLSMADWTGCKDSPHSKATIRDWKRRVGLGESEDVIGLGCWGTPHPTTLAILYAFYSGMQCHRFSRSGIGFSV